jgi:hypothetical protein
MQQLAAGPADLDFAEPTEMQEREREEEVEEAEEEAPTHGTASFSGDEDGDDEQDLDLSLPSRNPFAVAFAATRSSDGNNNPFAFPLDSADANDVNNHGDSNNNGNTGDDLTAAPAVVEEGDERWDTVAETPNRDLLDQPGSADELGKWGGGKAWFEMAVDASLARARRWGRGEQRLTVALGGQCMGMPMRKSTCSRTKKRCRRWAYFWRAATGCLYHLKLRRPRAPPHTAMKRFGFPPKWNMCTGSLVRWPHLRQM